MKFYNLIFIILIVFFKTGNVLSDTNIFDVNNIEIEKEDQTTNEILADRAIKKGFKELIDKILLSKDIANYKINIDIKSDLYPYGGTWLFPVFVIYMLYVFWYDKIVFSKAKKYWALFKKLLASSFTLVISNFANLMFLYTDIFIIKLIAENPQSFESVDFIKPGYRRC